MSTTSRPVSATPEQVWEVLSDGWLYPLWVVGASRMRDVDQGWPAVGTKLHHSVGTWPLLIDDTTEVLEKEEQRRLLLLARGWPAGQAHVEITLEPRGTDTVVTITEQATALRFVVFADRLYDKDVPVLASGVPFDALFTQEMMHGGYMKKYFRTVSRMTALVREGQTGVAEHK